MNLAPWHWHIEISSKCTLKCPRCARNEVPDTLINTELDLDFFKRNFTREFILEHVEKITFCGDDGDPIYARSLLDVIRYFKSIKPVSFVIVTNGSHKNEAWWAELSTLLTHKDHIHFSIDGWDDVSNNQYRVNSDWDSIMTGVKTVRRMSNVFLTWAAIGFSFNESNLEFMRHSAKLLGFDYFQLTKSTKFGKVYPTYMTNGSDVLQPSDTLVSDQLRFTRTIEQLGIREFDDLNKIAANLYAEAQIAHINSDILPLCHIGNKGLYISALGKLYPCCWVANRYAHNEEWNRRAIDLHTVLLVDALDSKFWTEEFLSFRWNECQSKCNKNVTTMEYCTQW